MFRDLKFKHKITLLPGMAAVGFLLILIVSLLVGGRNERILSEVENDYYPSLQLNRALEETTTAVHRQLEYAAAAGDTRVLSQTDVLAERFAEHLDQAQSQGVIKPEESQSLKQEMHSYYTTARQATLRLINGETGEELSQTFDVVGARYSKISSMLSARSTRSTAQISEAFALSRKSQQTSTWITTAIILLCLTLLVTLSIFVTRAVTTPLRHAVEAANSLAEGDLSAKIEAKSKDESGQLLAAISDMSQKLGRVIVQVRGAADALSGASAQVSDTSQDLSRDTSHQAASVEETTASLTQMASSINETAENSKRMEERAFKGADAAEKSA